MNQNPIDKLATDIQQVENILNRAKADVMNLVPEFESFGVAPAKNAGPDSSLEEKKTKSHFGWLSFRPNKSDTP